MKKTKLTRSLLAACSIVALSVVLSGCLHGGGGDDDDEMDTGGMEMPDPPPPPPSPMAASGSITLDATAQAALLAVLPDSGSSDTIQIEAGGTAEREGVTFSCDSAYDCTVTVTNSLGTILAEWSSQTLGSGTADVMASIPPPPPPPLPPHVPVSTFAELNDANTDSIRTLITTPTLQPTELTGMGLGGMGLNNADGAGLRSNFDPNTAAVTGTAGAVGAANGLMGGATLTGAMDEIDASPDMAPAPSGWGMETLFRDWGDTQGTGDGGFETGAIVVENHQGPTSHLWDANLAGRFVNEFNLPGVVRATDSDNPYEFTVRADGVTVDADNPADSVAFTVDATADTPGGEGTHVNANVTGAGSLAITVTSDTDGAFRTVSGQFLGVAGTYTCGTTDCALSRESGTDNFTLGAGDWQFTPNASAMVSVPDQDWMAYGAWMTTPDHPSGPHRIGTFFNGFDVYPADSTNLAAGGLEGSADYSGGATGVYVDGTASGLFTATATLTATFDEDGNGTADTGDYMISGQINDFRGADGVFLGGDTAAMPNDPDAGGENDWVVMLGASALNVIGTASTTSGSADGLPWAGTWLGAFFGPDTGSVAPSGVAGQFSASVTEITTAEPAIAAGHTAVTGVFGATRDE